MNGKITIQLKAALLLIVFLINTVIGFACAMGVDMGFNAKHHHNEEAIESAIHVHADGKKHQHHDEGPKHHHGSKEDSEKGGCCNDEVIKFQNLEKNLNQNHKKVIDPHIFATILNTLWGINFFNGAKPLPQEYKARVFHPPPPDILIAIQRFQI